MNDANHEPEIDLLDRATAALRNTPVFENPPQPIVAATIAAVNQRFTETEIQSPEILRRENERRQRMFRIARYGSLAAAVLLMAIGASVVLLSDRAASVAFGQVVENVKSAKSVSFTSIQKLSQQSPTLEFKFYLQGEQMRVELPGKQKAFDAGIPIVQATTADSRTRDVLEINYSMKTARKYKLDEATAKQFANPIDGFRDLTEKDAELIGEEELAGQKTQLYRIKKLNGLLGIKSELENNDSCKAWVDPKTGLPVKIALEASFSRDKENKGSLVFENFKWNEKLDKELFDPKIPDGFKVVEGNSGGNLEKSGAAAVPFPFSLVVDNVNKATSVSFATKSKFGSMPENNGKVFIQGDAMRIERTADGKSAEGALHSVLAFDPKSGMATAIDFDKRTVRITKGDREALEPLARRVLDAITWAKDEDAEQVGDERIDGRNVHVFRLNRTNYTGGDNRALRDGESVKAWVDAASGLPVKMVMQVYPPTGAGNQQTILSTTIEDFEWNKPLNDSLFKFDVPEGFTVVEGKPMRGGRAPLSK